jgi:hypothetical protein
MFTLNVVQQSGLLGFFRTFLEEEQKNDWVKWWFVLNEKTNKVIFHDYLVRFNWHSFMFFFLFIFQSSLESRKDKYLSHIFAYIKLWNPHALVSTNVGSGAFHLKCTTINTSVHNMCEYIKKTKKHFDGRHLWHLVALLPFDLFP